MDIGTSWPLCWSEEETLNISIDQIERSYHRSCDMVRWATGKAAPEPQTGLAPSGTPMTPKLFMAMFGKKKR